MVLHASILLNGMNLTFVGFTPCEKIDAYIRYIIDFLTSILVMWRKISLSCDFLGKVGLLMVKPIFFPLGWDNDSD